jgi:hypothetical protein
MDQDLMWVPLLDPTLIDMSYLLPEEMDRARDCLVDAMVAIEELEDEAKTHKTSSPKPVPPGFFSPPRYQRSVIDEFDDMLYGQRVQPSSTISNADVRNRRVAACKAEALRYLGMGEIPTQLPLRWWRENAHHFPTVRKLAQKWLGCMATSVPSERAFSTGGNVVTVKRAAPTPEMVENLVMLAQNAKAKKINDGG